MEVLIRVLQFLASLSLLVLIHEFGHFLLAKLFKTRVEKFYMFFNPWFSLFKFKKGETEYGIGWLPLGGYVKISGMIDESMDVEQMKAEPQPWEFRSKPAWQRLMIMVGGVLMNVILAIVIYIGLSYSYGEQYIAPKDVTYGYMFEESALALGFENGDKIISIEGNPVDNQTSYAKIALDIILNKAKYVEVDRNGEKATVYIEGKDFESMLKGRMFDARIPFVIGGIAEGSPAAAAGLQVGDSLIAVNGESVQFFDQFVSRFKQAKNETLTLTVMRNAEGVMVPTEIEATVSAEGTLGIYPYGAGAFLSVSTKKYNLIQAVGVGVTRAGQEIAGYWNQIKLLFDKDLKAYKSLGGFISIAKVFPGYWDWISFWHTTAFLSIILAVMNILPIPALDGGHVMFLLYEVVTRRKPSDKFMEYAQMFGLAVLLLLMVYANGNDIIKLFK